MPTAEDPRSLLRYGSRSGPGPRARALLQESPRRAHTLLRSSIRSGLLAQREQLVEDALVRSMATSRNAIRMALRMLASEGLVQRRTNLGTDVVRSPVSISIPEMLPLLSELSGLVTDGGDTEVDPGMCIRQLEYGLVPTTEVLRLRLDTDAEAVVMRELLVLLRGEPAAVIVGYHPVELAPLQLRDQVVDFRSGTSSLSDMISQLYGLTLGDVEINIESVACDERTARVLSTEAGAPLLVQETLVRDGSGRPFMLDYSHWRGDRVTLRAVVPPRVERALPD
ncbi:GntR family transcriptional regulator [Pseudonocardia pini]|uniref:GntR family transcriptional regulator n=1 Tax=Pseudonocardia pini TaxID=2758030 RepID=UPI0015EFE3BB|nr:GntR family transcriptional regulator [Pseudonocardia pini]